MFWNIKNLSLIRDHWSWHFMLFYHFIFSFFFQFILIIFTGNFTTIIILFRPIWSLCWMWKPKPLSSRSFPSELVYQILILFRTDNDLPCNWRRTLWCNITFNQYTFSLKILNMGIFTKYWLLLHRKRFKLNQKCRHEIYT